MTSHIMILPCSTDHPICRTILPCCAIDRFMPWWRHQMETFSALLALCAGNSPVTGEFPSQRPVRRSFLEVFIDLRLNKRLSKQSWGRWYKTPLRWLWRYCNETANYAHVLYIDCILLWFSSCFAFIVLCVLTCICTKRIQWCWTIC